MGFLNRMSVIAFSWKQYVRTFPPEAGYAYLCFMHILLGQASGIKHGLCSAPGFIFRKCGRDSIDFDIGCILLQRRPFQRVANDVRIRSGQLLGPHISTWADIAGQGQGSKYPSHGTQRITSAGGANHGKRIRQGVRWAWQHSLDQ